MATRAFKSYNDFFLFYLTQHSDPRNRALHCAGTLLGLAVVVASLATRHYWYALLFFVVGYGFAWTGHFLLERNRPATFGHPIYSFISDFRMVWLILTGQIAPWLVRAHKEGQSRRIEAA